MPPNGFFFPGTTQSLLVSTHRASLVYLLHVHTQPCGPLSFRLISELTCRSVRIWLWWPAAGTTYLPPPPPRSLTLSAPLPSFLSRLSLLFNQMSCIRKWPLITEATSYLLSSAPLRWTDNKPPPFLLQELKAAPGPSPHRYLNTSLLFLSQWPKFRREFQVWHVNYVCVSWCALFVCECVWQKGMVRGACNWSWGGGAWKKSRELTLELSMGQRGSDLSIISLSFSL